MQRHHKEKQCQQNDGFKVPFSAIKSPARSLSFGVKILVLTTVTSTLNVPPVVMVTLYDSRVVGVRPPGVGTHTCRGVGYHGNM